MEGRNGAQHLVHIQWAQLRYQQRFVPNGPPSFFLFRLHRGFGWGWVTNPAMMDEERQLWNMLPFAPQLWDLFLNLD